MRQRILILTIAASALAFAGCETPYGTPDRAGTGALAGGGIGALSGAVIGSASGHAGAGALIGGAIGAVTGSLVGHSMDMQEQERLRMQAPQTYVRVEQGQPLSVPDVKALAAARVSDDVIISQIRISRSVYRLSASEIIDLQNAGVSQSVISFMVNTPSLYGSTAPAEAQPPPEPPAETIAVSPGSAYVWAPGEYVWNGSWVWVSGHWILPPHPHTVWVAGYWRHDPYGWHRVPGHWR